MNILHFLVFLFVVVGLICEQVERDSKRWYFDRMCLRVSGFLYGAAAVCAIWGFVL